MTSRRDGATIVPFLLVRAYHALHSEIAPFVIILPASTAQPFLLQSVLVGQAL